MGYSTYVSCEIPLRNPRQKNTFLKRMQAVAQGEVDAGPGNAKGDLTEALLFGVENGCVVVSGQESDWRNLHDEELPPIMGSIAKFVKEGWMYFEGESRDGDFAVRFDGNGGWKQMACTQVYGDLADNFLDVFADQLPKVLKDKLEQWNTKRKMIEAV